MTVLVYRAECSLSLLNVLLSATLGTLKNTPNKTMLPVIYQEMSIKSAELHLEI